jgi:hypothetical protein
LIWLSLEFIVGVEREEEIFVGEGKQETCVSERKEKDIP